MFKQYCSIENNSGRRACLHEGVLNIISLRHAFVVREDHCIHAPRYDFHDSLQHISGCITIHSIGEIDTSRARVYASRFQTLVALATFECFW